jgi:hypothetical protein
MYGIIIIFCSLIDCCCYCFLQVNEEGFNGCFLPPQHSQLLVDCDDPTQAITFTYEFKRFSGVPGGKDFEPGQNYYIASK